MLNSTRIILCLFTCYLIIIKLKFREVLPGFVTSIGRDIVQLSLSIAPFILEIIGTGNSLSVSEIIADPSSIDFVQLAKR